ncbi:MAG: XRE family transcriptional regulator [Burkholderiales bacterium]
MRTWDHTAGLNDLLRGKIDKFSLDALVNMLARAGYKTQIKVTASRQMTPLPVRQAA